MGAASSTSGTPAFKEPVQFGTLSPGTFHEAVASIPHDRQIVLLGESTHGTEEFYRSRAAITKHLIEERGFKAVVFEADWPTMLRVNEFTHRRETAPFPDEWKHFPSWMWQNQCMAEFFDWCKKQLPEKKAELFGMDCYSLFESKRQVIAFLKQHDPEFCKEVEKRLAYMDRYTDTWKYADALINGTLSKISGHIDDTLTSIQSRLQWGSDKYAQETPALTLARR
jgi:erythromycin esterase-like protein